MEQFELSSPTAGTNNFGQQQQRPARERKLIQLRKYSPAICILEALLIAGFVAYLLVWHPHHHNSNNPNSPDEDSANLSRWQASRPLSCNQRKHDLHFSVKCWSKDTGSCAPVESGVQTTVFGSRYPSRLAATTATTTKQPTVSIVTTSRAGDRLSVKQRPVELHQCPQLSNMMSDDKQRCLFNTKLVVHLDKKQQQIIGWGGALTDSSINTLLSLTTNGTQRLLEDYFGKNGLKFNLVRITIGGSDFSSRFYTNDDLEANNQTQTDFTMDHFKLMEEDLLYKIPVIKYIQKEYFSATGDDLKLFASMWSPPTWMKTNNHFNKGQLKGSIDADLNHADAKQEQYFKALADLKQNFLLAYMRESVKFWGLTVMNEPLFAIQPFLNFNTMIFPSEDYGNYIAKHLGPTIRNNPQLKHVKLMVHDDNRRYLMSYTDPVMNKKDVRKYIDGVSVHGYADEAYDMMDEIYSAHRYDREEEDLFILPTELCSGHLPFMEKALVGNWHRGVHYALDIIRSLQHSAAGWVDWNMVLDTTGGPGWLGGKLDSPVIVDKDQDLYHKSPMFYVLGQFSRYIPQGSYKLEAEIYNSNYDQHFETVTFVLPGYTTLATVVLNNNPYPVELDIQLLPKQNSKDQDKETYQHFTCPPDSVTTMIYPLM